MGLFNLFSGGRDRVDHRADMIAMTAEVLAIADRMPAPSADMAPVVVENCKSRIIWSVPLSGRDPVYMTAARSNYRNDRRFVVFVKARHFYAHWRAALMLDPARRYGGGDVRGAPQRFEDIERDRKYAGQDRIWAKGLDAPVPLAKPVCNEYQHVDFTDGITRTLWLIRNGAAIFPVEAGWHDYEALHELVGVEDMPPESIEALVQKGGW